MINRLLTVAVALLTVGNIGFAQDGSFANLSAANFTKGSGANDFHGWGLNSNPLIDPRPNFTNRSSFVINHHDGLTFSAHSAYGGIRFYNQGYPTGPLDTSAGAKMVMSVNNNSLGFGTTNPRVPLDVVADISNGKLGAVLGRLPEGDNQGDGTFLGIRGYNTTEAYGRKSFSLEHSFYGFVNSSINFLRGGSMTGGLITFNTDSNLERMRIDPVGNVAIGTTDAKGYKLAVAGNMIAESIRLNLQSAWPDYVFDETYKLPSLSETEKHIKEKGHLPGIPSAAEVTANGVELGEMNKKLLEKIEELTLHLIEMKKENTDTKQELLKQREEMRLLKSLIKRK